jgi:hypothetical protein
MNIQEVADERVRVNSSIFVKLAKRPRHLVAVQKVDNFLH